VTAILIGQEAASTYVNVRRHTSKCRKRICTCIFNKILCYFMLCYQCTGWAKKWTSFQLCQYKANKLRNTGYSYCFDNFDTCY